jgi:predicted DNA binding CopG/RHH family protein
LLTALAAPGSAATGHPTAWHEDGLADDVATLSYERALRAHARYKPLEPADRMLTQPMPAEVMRFCEALPGEVDAESRETTAEVAAHLKAQPVKAELERKLDLSTAVDRDLKCASVTIRMSKAECVQLHRRAAEAGLTVSAYMRSCTFETESLRALVKDTLAQLKTGTPPEVQPVKTPPRRRWRQWLDLFRPHIRAAQNVAQA